MSFFILTSEEHSRFGTRWAYFDKQSSVLDNTDNEWCPVCGRSVSRTRHLPPLRIKLSSAKPEKWGDFVWGTFFTPLVSDRFKQIYDREGLTGIKQFYPTAEIVRVGTRKTGDFPTQLPTYYFIEVVYGAANQDDTASGVVYRPRSKPDGDGYCSYCHQGGGEMLKQERVVVEEGSWSGEDIFELRGGPPYPVVSDRFKQVIESARLKNCLFVPSERFAYDLHHPRGWHIK
jgi:hypothetical protein